MAQIETVTLYGPAGEIVVNKGEADRLISEGYSLEPQSHGEEDEEDEDEEDEEDE